jgi:putative restriction endonuclease
MRSFVGVTDGEWYRHLAAQPGLREVNFWRPSGGGRFGAQCR